MKVSIKKALTSSKSFSHVNERVLRDIEYTSHLRTQKVVQMRRAIKALFEEKRGSRG